MRRTFRRTFFHGIEIHLLFVSMLWPIGCLGHASFREASRRLPLWQFLLLVFCFLCLYSRSFFGIPLSRLAIHSTLLTSLNHNIVYLVVRHLRFCCLYFYPVLPLRRVVSSVCYIFPSLAMGSFRLTMFPRSDISITFLHFINLATYHLAILV